VVGGAVVGDGVGAVGVSGASTLRLRSSEDPPHPAAKRRSAANTKDKRLGFTFETLFSLRLKGSSADKVGVANHRQAQEEGLQEQLFVHVEAESAHRRVDVVDRGSELADAVGIVGV